MLNHVRYFLYNKKHNYFIIIDPTGPQMVREGSWRECWRVRLGASVLSPLVTRRRHSRGNNCSRYCLQYRSVHRDLPGDVSLERVKHQSNFSSQGCLECWYPLLQFVQDILLDILIDILILHCPTSSCAPNIQGRTERAKYPKITPKIYKGFWKAQQIRTSIFEEFKIQTKMSYYFNYIK